MPYYPPQPLLVNDESGEVLFSTYQPWCLPDQYHLAITASQYMFLEANIELFENLEITEEQAKLSESAFVLNSWTWVDQPKRNKPTMQQQALRSLLLKDDDYEEEEDE